MPWHLQCVGGHTRKHFSYAGFVQAIQGPPQAIIIQILGLQVRAEQQIHGFVGEELGGQTPGAACKAKGIEHHRLHGLSHGHLAVGRADMGINLLNQVDMPAHTGHNPQMIQPLGREILRFHRVSSSSISFWARIPENSSTLYSTVRNVGVMESFP
jgi:hypothetical protein